VEAGITRPPEIKMTAERVSTRKERRLRGRKFSERGKNGK